MIRYYSIPLSDNLQAKRKNKIKTFFINLFYLCFYVLKNYYYKVNEHFPNKRGIVLAVV